MPNDFSQDSRIIEVWRFENNLNAEKNGNHLTASAGGVGYYSTSPLEGSYSLDLEADNNQWAYRNDADLSDGFPLKSGDTNKKITIFFRTKPESVISGGQLVLGKAADNKYCFTLGFSSYYGMYLFWGYNNGTATEVWSNIRSVSANTVYHIALLIDGVAKTAKLRVYTGGTATNYTRTFSYELSVTDAAWVIGNNAYYNTSIDYDGLIDEVVVANVLLSDDELDLIYAGNYSARLVNSQTLGQIAYQSVPQLSVSQVLAQVAYEPVSALTETEPIDITGILRAVGAVEHVAVTPVDAVEIEGQLQVVAVESYAITEPTTEVVNDITAVLACIGVEPIIYDVVFEKEPIQLSAYLRISGSVEYVETEIAREIINSITAPVRLAGVLEVVRPSAITDYSYILEVIGQLNLVPIVETVTVSPVLADEAYLEATGVLRVVAEESYFYSLPAFALPVSLTGQLRLGAVLRLMVDEEPAPNEQLGRLHVYVLPLVEEADDAETWVLTGNGWQVSCYSNYGFNSYVNIGGICYGAKSDGIYLLEGDDDNGTVIRPGIRIISDFMTSNLKRLRHVQFGRCGRNAMLRVQGKRTGQKAVIRHEQQRFIVPRQLVDQEFVFDLLDFEEVSQAEFVVLPWVKR